MEKKKEGRRRPKIPLIVVKKGMSIKELTKIMTFFGNLTWAY